MNTRPITIYLLGLIFMLSYSCDNVLDKVEPSAFLPTDQVLSSVEDLEKILTGAYTEFGWDSFGGSSLTLIPDWMSDNAEYASFLSPGLTEITNFQTTTTNDIVSNFWRGGYSCINQANLVLAVLSQLKDPALTPELADRIRGEALFLRGVSYFELARFFGRPYDDSSASDAGVPILLQPTTKLDEIEFPGRATVSKVYDQAIADLEEAQTLLPETYLRGRANSFAAVAYLARIAFQQRDYARAAALTEAVLNGPFSLVPEPKVFYENEGSAEEIWSVVHNQQGIERGGLNFDTRFEGGGARTVIDPNRTQNYFEDILTEKQRTTLLQARWQAEDLRFSTLVVPTPDGDRYASQKYTDSQGGDDAPLLRLAEFFLMRAESLVRTQGINSESIELLNAIRTRAIRVRDTEGQIVPDGTAAITFAIDDFADAEALIEAIVRERRVELVIEGNRYHDLMRLRRGVRDIPYGDFRLTWPIPQREINANGNLEQNAGY